MPLLLCHECYFWVPPRNGRCPECDHPIDIDAADPPLDVLERMIGVGVKPIGCVRVRRKLLPELGTLYETANGLYFVPHVVRRKVELVERTEAGRSLMWTLASVAFMPLILILPFLRFRRLQAEEVPVLEPVLLDDNERNSLGRLLMDNPGAFFVRQSSVRRIRKRWSRWVIHRRIGPPLKLSAESDVQQFDGEMNELLMRDTWRHAALR